MEKYKSRHKSYDHQVTANKRLWLKQAFALLMAMRTGKTKVVLDDFGAMVINKRCNDLLVIAPAGVYRTWLGEIEEHMLPAVRSEIVVHLWEPSQISRIAQKRHQAFLEQEKARILLVDIEALSTVDRARAMCLKFLQTQRTRCVTVDESTTIKDPDSERSAFVLDKLKPLADYRRIMSGLPAPNSPFDIWSQFFFLDHNILGDSYVNHKNHYAEIHQVCMVPGPVIKAKLDKVIGDNFIKAPNGALITTGDMTRQMMLQELERRKIWVPKVPIIKKFRNEDQLHALIAPHSFRVRLEDCYDMPPKVYMKREVKLTPEQKRIYEELKHTATAELASKDFVTAPMIIVRLLRMHQVLCGHVRDEEGKFHEIKELRTKELLAQLAEYDGKAIIWCSYDPDVRKISEALSKEYGDDAVKRFWGGNTRTREQEEAEFKKNKKARFLIATPSAGGRGRTWSVANMMIYYSNTNNLEHRMQSEERGEGVGKQVPMTIIDLVAPGTVDEKIIGALRNKINMSSVINGDNYKEWLI